MAIKYDIDFEAGDFSEFDTDGSGAQLYVSAVSPISGVYSAVAEWTASNQYVLNNLGLLTPPPLGDVYHVGFKMNVNSFNFGTVQTSQRFFNISTGSLLFAIGLKKSGSDIIVYLSPTVDGTTDVKGGGDFTVEVRCVRASGLGVPDGVLELYINGISEGVSITNHNNYSQFGSGSFQFFRFTITAGVGHAGSMKFDDVIFRDDDTFIYPPSFPGHDLVVSGGGLP